METSSRSERLIESRKYFFLFGVLFTIIFYAVGFIYKPLALPSSTITEYIRKYGMYLPLTLGAISILKSYILLFIVYILHINHWISKVCIYLLIYGFWFVFGVQLRYYEPRYTDIAIALIDTYALPLLISSGTILIAVCLLSFFKKK